MNITLLEAELSRDEGRRQAAYRDTLGLWTIGVGHLLGPESHWSTEHWEEAKIDAVFQLDCANALRVVEHLPAYLSCNTDARQRALVNMGFQLGNKLLSFNTFLSLMQQQKWAEAAKDLRTTLWYKETPVRAERICKMIEQG